MFLLFDEEMNGTWYPYSPGQDGNTPADFVAMWKHVHDVFASVGATNVTWVWCPNIVERLADGTTTPIPLDQLYPGDAYVDWTGLNGYNWGGSDWESFSEVFRRSYAALLKLAPSKPIMIGEVASAEQGGSKAAWITDALGTELPKNFPQVKAVLWFNWNILENGTRWPWEIESSPSSQQAFATAINSSLLRIGWKLRQPPCPEQGPAAVVTASAGYRRPARTRSQLTNDTTAPDRADGDSAVPGTASVSVVICVYDAVRWDAIRRAVASLEVQTHPVGEVIVVVDHNRISSPASRVRSGVVAIENSNDRGLSGARNSGAAVAHGEFVAFLDDDAAAAPDWVERLVAACDGDSVLGAGGRSLPRWLELKPSWFPEEFLWVVGCTYRGLPEQTARVRNIYELLRGSP